MPASLAGTWTATGYRCGELTPPQLVRISQQGTLVQAHKLRGDDCVGDDQRTWEGSYAGRSPFAVRFFNAMGEAPGQVQVLAPERLVLRDKTDQVVTFVRQPTPNPVAKTAPVPAGKRPRCLRSSARTAAMSSSSLGSSTGLHW